MFSYVLKRLLGLIPTLLLDLAEDQVVNPCTTDGRTYVQQQTKSWPEPRLWTV